MKRIGCTQPQLPSDLIQEAIALLFPIQPEQRRMLEEEADLPGVTEEKVVIAAKRIANDKT